MHDVEAAHGLPRCLLFAVGSRETNLDPAYAEGRTGDGGHGHGLFQLDDRWHDIPVGFDTDPRAQAETAAAMLADLYQRNGEWLGACNLYNSGSPLTERTTGRDYGPDVLERRDYLAGPASPLGPIDDTPPDELDPLAAGKGTLPPGVATSMGERLAGIAPASLVALDARVDRSLAWMEANVGLGEYPAGSNANWLTDWYGAGHVAWCAITVSRALIEGGFGIAERIDIDPVRTTTRLGWAYCPYVEDDFRSAGRWHESDPEPGDLVLYDWDGDGWADHVGMLREIRNDGALLVYEGNTDEGALRLKVRGTTYVRGYARPPWSPTPAPRPNPDPQPEDDMATAASLNTLYNWGGGVFLLRPFGAPIILTSSENVIALLEAGCTAIGDVNDAFHVSAGGRTNGVQALSKGVELVRAAVAGSDTA